MVVQAWDFTISDVFRAFPGFTQSPKLVEPFNAVICRLSLCCALILFNIRWPRDVFFYQTPSIVCVVEVNTHPPNSSVCMPSHLLDILSAWIFCEEPVCAGSDECLFDGNARKA